MIVQQLVSKSPITTDNYELINLQFRKSGSLF